MPLTVTLTKLAVILLLVWPAAVFMSVNALNMFFTVADTFVGFDTYDAHGLLGGVGFYWEHLIGRVSAMFVFFTELALSDRVAPTPWQGLVFFRYFNHLMVIVAFYAAFRSVAPGLTRTLGLLLGLFAYLAAQSFWALPACPGCPPFEAAQILWLLDHSIYFFTAVMYLVVMGFLWRFLTGDLSTGGTALFLAFFFGLATSHEISLVVAGLVLAAMGVATLTGVLPRRAGPDRRAAALRVPAVTLPPFAAAYAGSAALQLLSPSLAFRESVWPPAMPLIPDAVLGGLAARQAVFERLLLATHPVVPAVFLAALLAGLATRPGDRPRRPGLAAAFLLLNLGCLTGLAFLMPILMVYGGRLAPGAQELSSMQHVFILFLGVGVAGFLGLLLATRILPPMPWLRRPAAIGAWAVPVLAAALSVLPSPAYREGLAYLSGDRRIDAAGMNAPNQTTLHARLDRQLSHPDATGTAYADEVFLHRGDPDNPAFRRFLEGNGTGLSRMYRLADIVYLPCELGPRPDVCNGKGGRPEHSALRFDDPDSLAARWVVTEGATARPTADGLRLRETGAGGEHYATAGPFEKGAQVAIRAAVDIAAPADAGRIGLYAISGSGSALQVFDLAAARPAEHGDFGGRVVRPQVVRLDATTLRLSAIFVLSGEAPTFNLRIQLVDDDGATGYPGNDRRAVTVRRAVLYLVRS